MSRTRLAMLVEEMAAPWTAAEQGRLLARRGHERLRAAGAGPDRDLPFTDRVIVTLVHLRFQLPHKALAVMYGVGRSTVSRAIGEVRPLLAARGFAVPGEPGIRLRTMADVFAYAAARGVTIRLDGTEVQVRRPRAGKPGREVRGGVGEGRQQHHVMAARREPRGRGAGHGLRDDHVRRKRQMRAMCLDGADGEDGHRLRPVEVADLLPGQVREIEDRHGWLNRTGRGG